MSEEKTKSNPAAQEAVKIKSISAGLYGPDVATLDSMAAELEVSRSVLVRFAVSDFLQRHQSGVIKLLAESNTSVTAVESAVTKTKPTAGEVKMAKKAKGKGKGKGKDKKGKKGKKKKKK